MNKLLIVVIFLIFGNMALFGAPSANNVVERGFVSISDIEALIALFAAILSLYLKMTKTRVETALLDAVMVAEMSKNVLDDDCKRIIFDGASQIMNTQTKKLIKDARRKLGKD